MDQGAKDQRDHDVLQNGESRPSHHGTDHRNQSSGYQTVSATSRVPDGLGHDELQYYRSFLNQLLDLVCNGDQDTVNQMVNVIRSGASHEDILAAMSRVSEGNGRSGQGENRGSEGENRTE
ncbi:hypothetical protein MW887_003769 [Aspergillus wentii]|nr:hypothetical protein MW887_003769 [Aspergillus wentii]